MRCQTIINYTLEDKPIFIVSGLSDRAFAHGFRILNPEFNATPSDIELGEEALLDRLFILDGEQDNLFHNYQKNTSFTPKQRAIYKMGDRK